jgi:hypothetical protein
MGTDKRADLVDGAKEAMTKRLQDPYYEKRVYKTLGLGLSSSLISWVNQQAKLIGRLRRSHMLNVERWFKPALLHLVDFAEALEEHRKQYQSAEKKTAAILRKYKWFISPSMPLSAINEILSIARKRGRKDGDINRLFIDYFSRNEWRNFQGLLTGWGNNHIFKRRISIFENCISVLQYSDKYNTNGAIVVLPTLIAQIDGILRDYLLTKNASLGRTYKDKKTQFRASQPKVTTDDLNELAIDVFLNILFQESQIGKPLKTPFNFNRHKILHGENTNYGRRDYVVRAIMVLDFLAWLK